MTDTTGDWGGHNPDRVQVIPEDVAVTRIAPAQHHAIGGAIDALRRDIQAVRGDVPEGTVLTFVWTPAATSMRTPNRSYQYAAIFIGGNWWCTGEARDALFRPRMNHRNFTAALATPAVTDIRIVTETRSI